MPATESLQPDDYGQVYISSPEGIRAIVTTADVCAQYDVFAESPVIDGGRANGVRITADGELTWIVGDLGNIPVIELDGSYDYTALGWTVTARNGSLHFTSADGVSAAITTGGVHIQR